MTLKWGGVQTQKWSGMIRNDDRRFSMGPLARNYREKRGGGSRGARMRINRGEESSAKTRKTSIYPRKKFIDSHMSRDG